jgi:hypothetical protein
MRRRSPIPRHLEETHANARVALAAWLVVLFLAALNIPESHASDMAWRHAVSPQVQVRSDGSTTHRRTYSEPPSFRVGATQCYTCGQGNYSASNGSSTCETCPPGTYSQASGSTACTPCQNGTYSASGGQAACSPCSPGTYAPWRGASTCMQCPAGTYSPSNGSLLCLTCATSTVAGSSVCTVATQTPSPTPSPTPARTIHCGSCTENGLQPSSVPFLICMVCIVAFLAVAKALGCQ